MTVIDPIAASALGDAMWWRRSDCPDAEEALRQYERIEASTPGDELLNAWFAERRVRLVWLQLGETWRTWTVHQRLIPDAVECWEVV